MHINRDEETSETTETNQPVDGQVPQTELVEPAIDQKPEVTIYPFANFIMRCKCGHEEVIEPLIHEGRGIQMIFTTNSASYMNLTCKSCGARLELLMVESSKEEISDMLSKMEKENESVRETSEGDKVDMGISNDNEQSSKTNI